MAQRLVVSEFPNDNPELHDGLVWACPTPCAPALPTLRLRPSAPQRVLGPDWETRREPERIEPEAVEERPLTAVVEAAPIEAAPIEAPPIEAPPIEAAPIEEVLAEDAPEPATAEVTESGFEAFVGALSGVLLERGATRSAASVAALLGQARLTRDAFDAATKKTLVARGLIDSKTARPTPEFSVVARAWRDVLEGTSSDLSGCGATTLDVWGAELLAALLGAPRDRADELRRALRQRGVAAFGMLAAA